MLSTACAGTVREKVLICLCVAPTRNSSAMMFAERVSANESLSRRHQARNNEQVRYRKERWVGNQS